MTDRWPEIPLTPAVEIGYTNCQNNVPIRMGPKLLMFFARHRKKSKSHVPID